MSVERGVDVLVGSSLPPLQVQRVSSEKECSAELDRESGLRSKNDLRLTAGLPRSSRMAQ